MGHKFWYNHEEVNMHVFFIPKKLVLLMKLSLYFIKLEDLLKVGVQADQT
jgi:hypothetical protein